jgi:release factor glutamine methyltransferase
MLTGHPAEASTSMRTCLLFYMPTIADALRAAVVQLDAARVDSPSFTARRLLGEVLGQPKEWLIAHGDADIGTSTLRHFQTLLARVMAHEPLAYVLGHREFYGLDLIADKRVLIPRPETEMLVELALGELRMANEELRKQNFSILNSQFSILDVGTGSGAIPIALAKHAPEARIIATDISSDALDVARLNAMRHGVSDRITFVQTDLLEGIGAIPTIVTANLPYVTREEIEGLPAEIQTHEPRVALDGGEDGLELVRRLLGQIASRVETRPSTGSGGASLRAVFLELGASQGAAALAAARAILPQTHSEIKKDLAGLDRVLAIRFSD